MEKVNFEPMDVGQIFDRTFKIYKQNFVRFIVIVAIIQVPFTLCISTFSSILQAGGNLQLDKHKKVETTTIDTTSEKGTSGTSIKSSVRIKQKPILKLILIGVVGLVFTALLAVIGFQLCQGALIKCVSEYYLGNDISTGDSYRFVLPRLFSIIWASIMISVVVGIGFVLLVVPGVIFGLWFALTIPVILLEQLGASSGMSRSRQLVSGNLGKVFGVSFLVLIINWIIGMPFGLLGFAVNFVLFTPGSVMHVFTTHFFSMISNIICMPIGACAFILLYYDLRIRKEGFDLEMLAKGLETDVKDS